MTATEPHDSAEPDDLSSVRIGRPCDPPAAIRCIVVGVDGSERSADAVALASRLGRAAAAELVVAAVCPVDGPGQASLTARDEAWRRIDRVRPLLEGFERWKPQVVDAASPARGLHELAGRTHAELLVIGSTHRGPVSRVVLGRLARRLLHGASCAVAITPRGHRPAPPGTPLLLGVGFDGSSESRLALDAGARWARDLGAGLRVVSALELPIAANPVFGTVSFRHTLESMRRFARDRLVEACASVEVPSGVAYEIRERDPVAVLADESARVDLLIVGSRAYGPVRTVLLGGVSGPVVERATCPVLVVPRGVATAAPDGPIVHAAPAAGAA
jgi:nucleotide-binding universal stress UspA family protein